MSDPLQLGIRDTSQSLFSTVVEGGYCIGCGMCSAFSPDIGMQMDEFGQWQAVRKNPNGRVDRGIAGEFCPFADGNPNEDELAQELFPSTKAHGRIGRYLANYAGYVEQGDFRAHGSSGGVVSWILCQLLEGDHADAVVHVGATGDPAPAPMFGFVVSRTTEEIRSRSKSRYYPVEMSGVVRHMLENPGRYAVVGLPCFIKALRLACRQSEVLRSRITHTVGIVCGHLKSRAFAEMMAWQCGIAPADLRSFDFRTKQAKMPASHYAITAAGISNGQEVSVVRPVAEMFGTNWSYGLFKYQACDYCDDVLAETADVAVGDAWLPEYVPDCNGTSIVTVRTRFFDELIKEGIGTGSLHLDALSADRVAESQDGGLRHRRDGLSWRLEQAKLADRWAPTKRVSPGSVPLNARQKKRFAVRQQLAASSHTCFFKAKREGRFEVFKSDIKPLMDECDKLTKSNAPARLAGKLRRLPRKLFGIIQRVLRMPAGAPVGG